VNANSGGELMICETTAEKKLSFDKATLWATGLVQASFYQS
jgi:hypothetical protein